MKYRFEMVSNILLAGMLKHVSLDTSIFIEIRIAKSAMKLVQ